MSAEMDWIDTVLGIISAEGPLRSFGGYREVLKRVFTSVDFPRPDSPKTQLVRTLPINSQAIVANQELRFGNLKFTTEPRSPFPPLLIDPDGSTHQQP